MKLWHVIEIAAGGHEVDVFVQTYATPADARKRVIEMLTSLDYDIRTMDEAVRHDDPDGFDTGGEFDSTQILCTTNRLNWGGTQ